MNVLERAYSLHKVIPNSLREYRIKTEVLPIVGNAVLLRCDRGTDLSLFRFELGNERTVREHLCTFLPRTMHISKNEIIFEKAEVLGKYLEEEKKSTLVLQVVVGLRMTKKQFLSLTAQGEIVGVGHVSELQHRLKDDSDTLERQRIFSLLEYADMGGYLNWGLSTAPRGTGVRKYNRRGS